jgi:hypothetical protein
MNTVSMMKNKDFQPWFQVWEQRNTVGLKNSKKCVVQINCDFKVQKLMSELIQPVRVPDG